MPVPDCFSLRLLNRGYLRIQERRRVHLWRNHWRLFWNREPGHILTTSDRSIMLHPGIVSLIAPYTEVEQSLTNPVHTFFVHFSLGYPFDLVRDELWEIELSPLIDTLRAQVLHEFEKSGHMESPRAEHALKAYIHTVLGELPEHVWENYPNIPEALLEILALLKTPRGWSLSLREIAAYAGISRATLFLWFREYLKTTPHEWRLQYRLERIAHDLLYTGRTISELAREYHFCSRDYLSRQFRTLFGVSPREYRRQHDEINRNP
ncbi:MAG: AraC family transcriptional regulator [Lentisphaerae bacterium]|nr:MAG: AraC family transcriptional regulator [Lentisphaerota bacterium]